MSPIEMCKRRRDKRIVSTLAKVLQRHHKPFINELLLYGTAKGVDVVGSSSIDILMKASNVLECGRPAAPYSTTHSDYTHNDIVTKFHAGLARSLAAVFPPSRASARCPPKVVASLSSRTGNKSSGLVAA